MITTARRNSTPRSSAARCERTKPSAESSHVLSHGVINYPNELFSYKKNHIHGAEFVKCWKERGGSFFLSVWEEGKKHPRAGMNYASAVETEEDRETHPKPNGKARAPLFICFVLPVELTARQEKATCLINEVKTLPLVSDVTLG